MYSLYTLKKFLIQELMKRRNVNVDNRIRIIEKSLEVISVKEISNILGLN